jgi:phosphohistidine phosphatase
MAEWSYPMEIYILRHGIAEEAAPGMKDSDRALTSEGAAKLETVLRRARAAGVEPSVILTSPYLRARQTAEIAANALRCQPTLLDSRALVPDSSPEAVWNEIRTHKAEPQVLIAGHEPLLSAVYAYLLGEPSVQIDVKKGSLGRVDVDRFSGQPRGVLRWLLYPKLVG